MNHSVRTATALFLSLSLGAFTAACDNSDDNSDQAQATGKRDAGSPEHDDAGPAHNDASTSTIGSRPMLDGGTDAGSVSRADSGTTASIDAATNGSPSGNVNGNSPSTNPGAPSSTNPSAPPSSADAGTTMAAPGTCSLASCDQLISTVAAQFPAVPVSALAKSCCVNTTTCGIRAQSAAGIELPADAIPQGCTSVDSWLGAAASAGVAIPPGIDATRTSTML